MDIHSEQSETAVSFVLSGHLTRSVRPTRDAFVIWCSRRLTSRAGRVGGVDYVALEVWKGGDSVLGCSAADCAGKLSLMSSAY